MYNFWIILTIFLASFSAIVYHERAKRNLEAQFIVTTGVIVIVFYAICFLSGICTILNFLWNWVL